MQTTETTETTFTPGPLVANVGVAILKEGNIVGSAFGRPVAESEANAVLWSAAPELYEALRDIMEHVPEDDGISSLPIQRQRIQAALSALAKAGGGK